MFSIGSNEFLLNHEKKELIEDKKQIDIMVLFNILSKKDTVKGKFVSKKKIEILVLINCFRVPTTVQIVSIYYIYNQTQGRIV